MADLQVRFDPNILLDLERKGTRRAAAFVAVARRAWDAEPIGSLEIPAEFSYRIFPEQVSEELSNQVKQNFRLWTLGNALLEIERNLALFLQGVHSMLIVASYHRQKTDDQFIKRRAAFERLNLERRVAVVEQDFGVAFELAPHIPGWVRARNCLAHRNGLVSLRDCSGSANSLKMSWRRMEMVIGGQVVPHGNARGFFVEKDSTLAARFGTAEVEFSIGTVIELTESNILEVCLTADLLSANYVGAVDARAREMIAARS